MSNARLRTRMKIGDPSEVERFVEETKDAIGDAVMIMDGSEKEMDLARREYDKAFARALLNAPGPQYQRSAAATLDDDVDKAKDAYDIAKRAFHYAEREARSLEKELFAWQSILNSVRSMWNATGGQR
jgi:hypothetical protein